MSNLAQQVRLALRTLARTPLFTGVAVLTLAVAIGANTAIFSVVNSVLLEPLPYPESDRLVSVYFTAPGVGYPEVPFSDGAFIRVREGEEAFAGIAMYGLENVNLTGEGAPERLSGVRVTPNLFEVLRSPPALGRAFTEADGQPGAEPVVILSHDLWMRRYGADQSVVGRTLQMDGEARRVVGVAAKDFAFPAPEADVWRPLLVDPATAQPGNFSYPAIARLEPGVDIAAATADLDRLIIRFSEAYPEELPMAFLEQARFAGVVKPLKEQLVGDVGQALWMILGTVGFVLLIACANVANLFLVRAEGRGRELAVRSALGARRGDLAGLFLGESLILGLLGGAMGLLLAFAAVRGLLALAPGGIPRLHEIGVNGDVLAFTAGISLVAGLFFGSFPAFRYRPADLSVALKEGGRASTTGGERHRARSTLVVVQVAMALVLLVASGLMVRSFERLRAVDPGFDSHSVLTVRLALSQTDYPDDARVAAFWTRLRERIAELPGATSVGAVNHLPLGDTRSSGSIGIEDHPTADDELPPVALQKMTTPGYFRTLGIPLIEGRAFEPGDAADGFRAAVVNRAFAERWWPGESPLGRRVRLSESEEWYEIVGVVGNVREESLEKEPGAAVYFPHSVGARDAPRTSRSMALVVRTAGDPRALMEPVRDAIWSLDPNLPIASQRTMEDLVSRSMARTSFTLVMLGIGAALALLLGAVGIYGVLSYAVSQRTRELGIRMALGASASGVRRMVVRQGLQLALIGVSLGLIAAYGLSGLLQGLLYEVSATDPLSYVAVTAVLVAVAVLACYLPARRASSTDPLEALRQE